MTINNLVQQIFALSGFSESGHNDQCSFYSKIGEYFLISEYSQEEFNNFFNSETTSSVLYLFKEKKREIEDVEKNTSLIILLKTDNLEDGYESNKHSIFRVEEDEYYFRKYVVLYSEDSLRGFSNSKNNHHFTMESLQDSLNDNDKFEQFQWNFFSDPVYYLLIQLFVKLPFLEVKIGNEEFQPLEMVIENKKTEQNKKLEKAIEKLPSDPSTKFSEIKEALAKNLNNPLDELFGWFK